MPAEIVLYGTPWCPYCTRARHLLSSKGLPFEDINVAGNPALRAEMERLSGATSVPQIWINDRHIGGCNELYDLEFSGKLDQLIQ